MLRTGLFFYKSVLLHQKTLVCEVILVLNWRGYDEIEKFEYFRHGGAPEIDSRGWMNMVVKSGYKDARKKVGKALREE